MNFTKNKALIIIAILIIGLGLFLKKNNTSQATPTPSSQNIVQNDSNPKIVSISPKLGDGAYIAPTQTINITFNLTLKNAEQFKSKMDPDISYSVVLSEDKKTAKITPKTPYALGHGYTLYINQETSFDDGKSLGHSEHYSFQTVDYNGI